MTIAEARGADQSGRARFYVSLKGLALSISILATSFSAHAQSGAEPPLRHEINRGLVEIMGPALHTTASEMAADMARLLSDGNDLRVVPNIGRGSFQTIQDLLFMRGIDIGLVNSAVLQFFREKNVLPGLDLDKHVRYIAPYYPAEFHVFARSDVRTIYDLEGQDVSFGSPTSASNMTSSLVFGSLDITPNVVHFNHSESIQKVKNGEIAAFTISDGKPWNRVLDLKPEDGVHLLEIPAGHQYRGSFGPAVFTSDDYPNLIAPGETIQTLSNQMVMAVYNWPKGHPRHANVVKFGQAFFAKFNELQTGPSNHPKWKEVNPYLDVPGWQRFDINEPSS